MRQVPQPLPLDPPPSRPPPRRAVAVAAGTHPHPLRGGDPLLILSFSIVVLLGLAVFVLCRFAALRLSHAVVCVLFGFYLASSPLAPTIADAVETLTRLVSGR